MAETQSPGIETGMLSHYGKAIAQYQGRGFLTLEDGRQMQCSFVTGQLAAGDVLLLCELHAPISEFHLAVKTFEGTTDKNHRVAAQRGDNGRGIDWCPFLPEREGCWHAFHVWELRVEMAGGVAETKAVRFGLTNLTFDPPDTDKSGQSCLRLILESASDRTELSIVRLPGYGKIVEYFRILGATDLTSEAVIDTAETQNAKHLENVVDNLCHLLSVARGTLIQWVYLDFCDGDGRCFERRHYARRTKPYNSHELIDSNRPAETKEFLQQSYKTYVAKRDSYRLNKGLIISYMEAKASDDNIQRKGIKLAVTLEMLKAVYFGQSDNLTKERILDKTAFKTLQKKIESVLAEAVSDKSCRDLIQANVQGLNRRSFKDVLQDLFAEIHLSVGEEDINRFVKCRNSLIHRGRFHCTTTTPPDNSSDGMLNEFGFMLNLVDRIFLKLLGYGGRYRDWTFPKNTVLREQV